MALRITQIVWVTFVCVITVTGFFWTPLKDENTPWTLDMWVHDMGSWSPTLVMGYGVLGLVHGSLFLPLPLLILGSCATVYSGGGASIIHDVSVGGEIRDAVGICSWLFAYFVGVLVSARVVVPIAGYFITTDEQAEALRCSKERLEYDLAAATHKKGVMNLALRVSSNSPTTLVDPMVDLSTLPRGQLARGAASVASSESLVASMYTAREAAEDVDMKQHGAREKRPSDEEAGTSFASGTTLSASDSPLHQPTDARCALVESSQSMTSLTPAAAPRVQEARAPSVVESHCTESSMLTLEADVKMLEQQLQLQVGSSEAWSDHDIAPEGEV